MEEKKQEYRADIGDLAHLAYLMRRRNNDTLSTLYTQLEAVFTESKQLEALKSLVKWEIWKLNDDNQDTMYKLFRGEYDKGEPYPESPEPNN